MRNRAFPLVFLVERVKKREGEKTGCRAFLLTTYSSAPSLLYNKLTLMIKALFFDIDGTLVSFNTHEIPQSAVDAIAEAKRRGIGVYISTGRPMRLINNLGAIEHLIDGYITATGAYCTIGGREVVRITIPDDEARAFVSESFAEGFATLVVGVSDLTVINPNPDVDRLYRQMLNVSYLGEGVNVEDVLREGVIQFTPIIDLEAERRLMPMMPGCVSARWYPDFADITARGADKGTALLTMAARLGIDVSETMAFGDGGNDKPIIRSAGIGIAMGNATDEVKAAADYVTTSVDDDGIRNALVHFGVIG